jgi:hypothetical protein
MTACCMMRTETNSNSLANDHSYLSLFALESIELDVSSFQKAVLGAHCLMTCLNWPSGANLLAHMQLRCILYVPL